MKIDSFTHVITEKYKEAFWKYSDKFRTERNFQENRPALTDQKLRMRVLNKYEDVVQVLSATLPPLEEIVSPEEAVRLARISNDEMADQLHTHIQGKPLSSEEFMPLYEVMAGFDLPIWIHPCRRVTTPDYATEDVSYSQLFSIFGWPYDTTAAMIRLVFSGIFEKYPGIKFIIHHCGAMVPYFADRITVHYNNGLQRLGADHFPGLTKHPIEYLRMFYADTALNGNSSALMCAYDFYGEDHILFATDMPYDPENGAIALAQTIEAIEGMEVPEMSKKKIYEDNARKLLHL